MKLQQLYSYTRRAIDTWQMIDDGDRIAIGVSGGKDSLTMLYALKGLQRFYPKHFELEAITVTSVSETSIWTLLSAYAMN
mgnify:CR=1 FL=1